MINNGPKLSTVTRKIIEKDGLYFKDIDGTGEVSKVNDWRLPAAESAKAYAELLTAEEKSDSSSFLTGVWANILHQMYRMIPIVQGSEDGVTTDGVELTMKHFPGGGACENGYDPHYAVAIMPYYAKEKSAAQVVNSKEIEMQPFGFAYNKPLIDGLLRDEMGFKGYVNSDTGIVHNMCWGVEMLDKAERIGFAVNHSGVDVIRGKDQHLPDELKDENGKAYAYRDAAGNYYEMNFGLTY